jgi:hypothetical protein
MAFALNSEKVEVVVRGGVVRLSGRVDRRALAETIVEEARGLLGIVGVASHLTWEMDDVDHPAEPGEREVRMTLRPR